MNSINIDNVVAVSVFRENGHMKLSTLDSENIVTEISLYSADSCKSILLHDSEKRVPCTPADFGIVK